MQEEEYLGYLKYSGKSVEDGLLDMRKSADALLGLDEILRYFIAVEEPSLRGVDFDMPVRIKKGTWGIWIPAAVFTTIYAGAIAKKAGTDGFLETGPKKDIQKIIRGSIKAAQWVIKIASHRGKFEKGEIKGAKIEQIDNEIYVEIPNESEKYLVVPKEYFDLYVECPKDIFSKATGVIEEERILEIAVIEDGQPDKVMVTKKEKQVFYIEPNEDNGVVLPELEHGQHVSLIGEITRATESTNTIGFRYKEHVLVCKPVSGNIAKYKTKIIAQEEEHFFPRVKITGIVDREDIDGKFKEKKPRIFFADIIPIEESSTDQPMF